jgi:CheY-like chemotaxis protein
MAWNELRYRARVVESYGDTPPVQANEARLGQVFLNLIVNAAQAMPEGHVEEHTLRITTGVDGDGRVAIEIADTGAGMPPEVMARLFTPFFTTKPVGVGTGLGLAISHRIIANMGGTIEFTSEVGRGTSFRIVLPAAPGVVEEPPPPAVVAPVGRRGRVLVVDDEPMILRAVHRILSVDHDVLIVDHAAEALDRINAGERFDVILCDLMMPQMSGMEFHEELGKLDPQHLSVLVFLTGGAFTARAREFLDQVRAPSIEKPFDPEALRLFVNDRIR